MTIHARPDHQLRCVIKTLVHIQSAWALISLLLGAHY